MQDFIVQNFKDVSFFKRAFGDPFIFIIVVTIGWYKFCIGTFFFGNRRCYLQLFGPEGWCWKKVQGTQEKKNHFYCIVDSSCLRGNSQWFSCPKLMVNSCTDLKSISMEWFKCWEQELDFNILEGFRKIQLLDDL